MFPLPVGPLLARRPSPALPVSPLRLPSGPSPARRSSATSLPDEAHPPPPPLMQRCRGREGDPGRPEGGRSAAAGANITPATGRGRFALTPHATRGGRGTANSRDYFRVTAKGEYGGAGGVEGNFPLSPHAPRRAGDLPPAPGSSRKTRKEENKKKREEEPPLPYAPRRAGDPPPAPGSSRKTRKEKEKE